MATETILIEIQTQMKESAEELKKVKDELKGIKEGQKEIQDNSAKTAKGLKGIGMAFKGVGTAMKAMGIGLIIKAFDLLSEILMENQIAVDAFSTAFEFMSLVVSDFINWITANGGEIAKVFTDIFENPKESIMELVNWLKDRLLTSLEGLLLLLPRIGKAVSLAFKGEWKEATKVATDAVAQVAFGFEDATDKVVEFGEKAGKAIGKYAAATYEAAQAQTELNKAAELAEARNRGIIEDYDRQAEGLRQIRDDETKTLAVRIKANEDLGELLKKQQTVMLANANLRLQQAQAKKALDATNHQAQLDEIDALNEIAGIRAQIKGFESEQLSNQLSLQAEVLEKRKEAQSDFFSKMASMVEEATDKEIEEREKVAKKQEELDDAELARRESNIAAVGVGFAAMNVFFEENAKAQKAIAIAETIWNTATGIMATVKNLGLPAAIPFVAATAALGIAQLASITRTSWEEGGDASIQTPSVSVPAVNTSINTLERDNPTLNQADQQPTRAFVVSGDVTTQQSLDRRILSNATFG